MILTIFADHTAVIMRLTLSHRLVAGLRSCEKFEARFPQQAQRRQRCISEGCAADIEIEGSRIA